MFSELAMMLSSVIASPASSVRMRPWYMISTRSHIPISSS